MNTKSNYKICVATSVHYAFDTRIYYKQVRSLSKNYIVDYYAQKCADVDPKPSGTFVPLPMAKSKFKRISISYHLYKLLKNSDYQSYHFHDLELFPLGLYLKFKKKIIIFDIHEDISQQIRDKEWIHLILRRLLSYVISKIEKWLPILFNYIILSDDDYLKKYDDITNIEVIHNYPINQLQYKKNYGFDIFRMVYVGDIRKVRGIFEYLKILQICKENKLNVSLFLVGKYADSKVEKEVRDYIDNHELEKEIANYGRLPNHEIYRILTECDLGLALLHPIKNYIASYPTKLFEYMSIGLPVLTSNFELWKKIVDNKCGYAVDPLNVMEAVQVLRKYYSNTDLRKKHGQNGRKMVHQNYKWEDEEKKLMGVYEAIIPR